MIPATALLTLLLALNLGAQSVEPYAELNSPGDDYAAAVRVVDDRVEMWVTTAEKMPFRSRRIVLAARESSESVGPRRPLDSPVNQRIDDEGRVWLDGCPTFSLCDPRYGVFTSNRVVGGRSFDNDLYAMVSSGEEWRVERLYRLSSPGWDDTPALSPDGDLLYFASDRANPGSGLTDVYVSRRTGNDWGEPVPVGGVNSDEHSEQTPFMATDGRLYYSTNRGGDYDIWVVTVDATTGLPTAEPRPLELDGVNRTGSDEGHPVLSPAADRLIFSSNRGRGDLDLYRVAMPQRGAQILRLRVFARELEEDGAGSFHDVTRPVPSAAIEIRGSSLRSPHSAVSGPDGEYVWTIPPSAADAGDRQSLIVTIRPTGRHQIPSVDTLYYSTTCTDTLTHSLYLWDTTVYFSSRCEQDFPVSNVQFFITGYWCPTTRLYSRHTPCRSVFDDDFYTSVEACPPNALQAAEDDLYTYRLHDPWVESEPQEGLCIRWNEMRARGDEFAAKVDSSVRLYVENMRSALQAPCVARALESGDTIRVYVTGWTDPRDIHPLCRYTGSTIDFDREDVQLQRVDGSPATGLLEHGTGFREYDRAAGVDRLTEGNQLLSELRAFYTATMFDGVWREQIPEYRELRRQKRVVIVAVGRAIKQENLDFEQRRSVDVRVVAPTGAASAAASLATGATVVGTEVVLCGGICGEN